MKKATKIVSYHHTVSIYQDEKSSKGGFLYENKESKAAGAGKETG